MTFGGDWPLIQASGPVSRSSVKRARSGEMQGGRAGSAACGGGHSLERQLEDGERLLRRGGRKRFECAQGSTGRHTGADPGGTEQVEAALEFRTDWGITRKHSTGKDKRECRRVVTPARNGDHGGEMLPRASP